MTYPPPPPHDPSQQWQRPVGGSPDTPYTLSQLTTPAGRPPRRGLSGGAIVGIVAGVVGVALIGLCCVGWVAYQVVDAPQAGTSRPAAVPTTIRAEPAVPTPDKPEVVVVPLGQELVMTSRGIGSRDTTHWLLIADKTYTRSPKFSLKPDRGIFYVVRAGIEVTEGSNYVYAGDFAFIAADGTAYEPESGFGFDGALQGVELQAGQKTGGLVVFDVPQAAIAGAKIQLRDGGYNPDSDQAYWQL